MLNVGIGLNKDTEIGKLPCLKEIMPPTTISKTTSDLDVEFVGLRYN